MSNKYTIEILIDEISLRDNKIDELEQGACRFNCRTAKENWIAGWEEGVGSIDFGGDPEYATGEEAYNEWKRLNP